MISGIAKIVLPVDDQERAKRFWTTQMGFELQRDESSGDEHLGWWSLFEDPDGTRYALGQWE